MPEPRRQVQYTRTQLRTNVHTAVGEALQEDPILQRMPGYDRGVLTDEITDRVLRAVLPV